MLCKNRNPTVNGVERFDQFPLSNIFYTSFFYVDHGIFTLKLLVLNNVCNIKLVLDKLLLLF